MSQEIAMALAGLAQGLRQGLEDRRAAQAEQKKLEMQQKQIDDAAANDAAKLGLARDELAFKKQQWDEGGKQREEASAYAERQRGRLYASNIEGNNKQNFANYNAASDDASKQLDNIIPVQSTMTKRLIKILPVDPKTQTQMIDGKPLDQLTLEDYSKIDLNRLGLSGDKILGDAQKQLQLRLPDYLQKAEVANLYRSQLMGTKEEKEANKLDAAKSNKQPGYKLIDPKSAEIAIADHFDTMAMLLNNDPKKLVDYSDPKSAQGLEMESYINSVLAVDTQRGNELLNQYKTMRKQALASVGNPQVNSYSETLPNTNPTRWPSSRTQLSQLNSQMSEDAKKIIKDPTSEEIYKNLEALYEERKRKENEKGLAKNTKK